MSLEQLANGNKRIELELESIKCVVRPLSTRNLLRLLSVVDRLRSDMKLTREDLEQVKLNAAGITDLFQRIFAACVGSTDLSKPGEVNKNAQLLFNELALVLECKPEDLLDATVDDLSVVVEKFYEVNSSGPLGVKIRSTTAGLAPTLKLAKEVATAAIQSALIKVLQSGGTTDGGQTGFSTPSTESSDGLSTTS